MGALGNNTTGGENIALGAGAGGALMSGGGNIYIGNPGLNKEESKIRIGDDDLHRATFIAGIKDTPVVGDMVFVNGETGQLGTEMSAARFKKEIKPMDKTSEAILALKPVSFQYKSDSKATKRFGLIAEDVAKVNPDLVVRDRKGEIYSVRYEAVNAMLLNEFLKEHRKVEEQEATITQLKSTVAQQQKDFQAAIAQQQRGMEAVTARLEQQIQKVSARLDVSKTAPRVVLNNQ